VLALRGRCRSQCDALKEKLPKSVDKSTAKKKLTSEKKAEKKELQEIKRKNWAIFFEKENVNCNWNAQLLTLQIFQRREFRGTY